MTPPDSPEPLDVVEDDVVRAAFERTAVDRDQVDTTTIQAFNLNSVFAARRAMDIERKIAPFVPIMHQLPVFDMTPVLRFLDYAYALLFVHGMLVARQEAMKKIPELAQAGFELRKVLMEYLDFLCTRGLVPKSTVDRLRDGSGHDDLVGDLQGLTRLFQAHPEFVGGIGQVTEEEVARAAELSHTIATQIGIDREPDHAHADLRDQRHRAGHLLIRAHAQIRRAVQFIRFDHGDADVLVPSLYVSPKDRPRRASNPERDPDPDPVSELAAAHDALHAAEPPHEPYADDPFENPFVDVED